MVNRTSRLHHFNLFIKHEIIQYRFRNHEKYDTFCANSGLAVCACMILANKFKFLLNLQSSQAVAICICERAPPTRAQLGAKGGARGGAAGQNEGAGAEPPPAPPANAKLFKSSRSELGYCIEIDFFAYARLFYLSAKYFSTLNPF